MEDKQELIELKLELKKVNHRLDQIENQAKSTSVWGSGSVWALIPIAAIVMWGLTQIFR